MVRHGEPVCSVLCVNACPCLMPFGSIQNSNAVFDRNKLVLTLNKK